jgi:hypothetical protein
VYSATIDVANQQGYAIRAAFPEAHVVSFTAERPRRREQDFTATAIKDSLGTTSVVVAGTSARSGYPNSEDGQNWEWQERKKLALHFLLEVDRMLATEPNDDVPQKASCPWCVHSKDSVALLNAAAPGVGTVVAPPHGSAQQRYEEAAGSLVRALKNTVAVLGDRVIPPREPSGRLRPGREVPAETRRLPAAPSRRTATGRS